jgi:predicted acylesterase/phospholipase RssA
VIALALATTDTATDAMAGIFKELAKKTFRNKRIRLDPYTVLGKVLVLIDASESIYSQIPLRESLKNLFGDRNLFSAIQASALTYGTRVAVTSARDDEANRCLIASYNRAELGYSDDFEREAEHDADLKIWQAGLATSAAPFFLPPYRHDLTDKEYVDGALFANCPASVAIEEKDKIWPGSSSLDYLISVGTGIQSRNENLPWLFKRRWGGMDKCLATFFRSLGTESIWTTFKQTFGGGRSTARRLHRLNVKITDRVRLDEYKEMDNLEKLVDAQVAEPIQRDTIARIARVIMAGLFFFEPDEDSRSAAIAVHPVVLPQRSQKAQLSGSIRCRLRLGSEELTTLLKQIDGFDFAEVVHPDEATEIPDHAWMSVPGFHVAEHDISTGTEKRFQLRHNLETELPDGAMLALAVRFNDNNQMIREPISGFPASLRELERRARAEM